MPERDDETMPQALRRARDYAAIFLNVGDRWHDYVPVDAEVVDDRVYVQGMQMWREGDTWHIGDGDGGHWAYRAAPTVDTGGTTEREGWAFPTSTARKCHYFAGPVGRSLCGRYGSIGLDLQADHGGRTDDDCVGCRRKLDARREQARRAGAAAPQPPETTS